MTATPDPENHVTESPAVSGVRPIAIGALRTDILAAPQGHASVFARHRAIECRDLLEPDLLASLLDRCHRGTFVVDHVEHLGSREVEAPQHVGGALNLMLNRAPFLRWVEAATGHRGLHRVAGRVVQTRANGTDGLDWHDDTHDAVQEGVRRLAITINLSDTAYEGGDFELRMVGTRQMLTTYRHYRAGHALIFDVAGDVEHRVLPISGNGPRRVFTGWFFENAASASHESGSQPLLDRLR